MKKRILFFIVALVAAITACQTNYDYWCVIHYIYANNSSSNISVHSVVPYNTGEMMDSLFVIPVNGQHTISLSGFLGYPRPFQWDGGSKEEYVTISNGEKAVTQTLADNGELYQIESYVVISEIKQNALIKTVKFEFTDDFFDNGEPVE